MERSDSLLSACSYAGGRYDLLVENELIKCRIYWARIVSGEADGLFTQRTKHTFFELQYALEGRIVMQVEKDRQIIVEPDHFVIITPDTFHQVVDGNRDGKRYIMAFTFETKGNALDDLSKALSKMLVYRRSLSMRKLLELLDGKQYHDELLRRRIISCYLESLILEIIEVICPKTPEKLEKSGSKSENEARVMEIERYISDYCGIGISPTQISEKFNISVRHLNRIFTSVRGKTLKEVINHQRLEKIEELVASTALSLREISELCAFSDEYSMNKFFKRYNHYGLTEYRALCTFQKTHPEGTIK